MISFKTAALGGVVDVPTVDGTKELKIPSGTQSGTVIKLKGLGVPHIRASGRGDHFVEIHIKVPDRLSRGQRKMLEDWEE